MFKNDKDMLLIIGVFGSSMSQVIIFCRHSFKLPWSRFNFFSREKIMVQGKVFLNLT
jgi:hypothetical protein